MKAFKNGELRNVRFNGSGKFLMPNAYELLSLDRIIGVDTETLLTNDGHKTCLVQIATQDDLEILHTRDVEYPVIKMLDYLFPRYAEYEERLSRTKQRPMNEERKCRDGRRQTLKPLVAVFYNGEYDYGRLVRNQPDLTRASLLKADNVTIKLGDYTIEIAELVPFGSAPRFQWLIRKDHHILQLFGRDMASYWKLGLKRTGDALNLSIRKDDLESRLKASPHIGEAKYRNLFETNWDEWTDEEMRLFLEYSGHDAQTTRELYNVTANLLVGMSEHVVKRDGTIPVSAPGAAAKICFGLIDWDNCPIDEKSKKPYFEMPIGDVYQYGAYAYCGGRVFSMQQGVSQDSTVHDISSAYPFWTSEIPDPVTSTYRKIEEHDGFDCDRFRGLFGVICISGEGLEENYPAIRRHDPVSGRIQYLYGPFEGVYTTIMEAVTGVVTGRLRIDKVHGGFYMDGKKDSSFLRTFVLKMYKLKSEDKTKGAVYQMAKLLMNSFYGKLAELDVDNPFIRGTVLYIPLPNTPLLTQSVYKKMTKAYVEHGEDGDGGLSDELITFRKVLDGIYQADSLKDGFAVYRKYVGTPDTVEEEQKFEKRYTEGKPLWDEDDETIFKDYFDKYQPKSVLAGRYYNPFWAAMITGHTSSQLGVWAFACQSLQADTDSGFSTLPTNDQIEQYHQIMERSGYAHPRSGLGSFECEVGSFVEMPDKVLRWDKENGRYTEHSVDSPEACPQEGDTKPSTESIFVKNKVYSVEYQQFTKGEWKTKYKQARHGIQRHEITTIERRNAGYSAVYQASLHELMRSYTNEREKEGFVQDAKACVTYKTEKAPRSLRIALIRGEEPGIFISEDCKFCPVENPLMRIDSTGKRTWVKLRRLQELNEDVDLINVQSQVVGDKYEEGVPTLYTFTMHWTTTTGHVIITDHTPSFVELQERLKRKEKVTVHLVNGVIHPPGAYTESLHNSLCGVA